MKLSRRMVILVSIFVLAGFVYYGASRIGIPLFQSKSSRPPSPLDKSSQPPSEQDAQMSELRKKLLTSIVLAVPETDERITLSGEQGAWSRGYVRVGDMVAPLPQGAVVTTLEVNAGGNAEDVYLAVFEMGENAWEMSAAQLLGDYASNAEITRLSTDSETIYVDFMTYSEAMQAQAEDKTVPNSLVFSYIDKVLTQVSPSKNESGASGQGLVGTSWKWARTEMNSDEVFTPKPGDFVMTFTDETSFISTSDCNTIQGQYGFNASTGQITFDKIIQTKMFCPNSLEDKFVGGLQSADRIVLNDDELIIQLAYDGGAMYFTR